MRYVVLFVLAVLAVALGVLLAPHLAAIVAWTGGAIIVLLALVLAFGALDLLAKFFQWARGDFMDDPSVRPTDRPPNQS